MPVRYKTALLASWISAETRNIGTGGAFIATAASEQAGTTLTVEVQLPTSQQTFTLPAVVRWVSAEGMGVQFVGVDVDVLLELNEYFASLTATPTTA